MLASSIRDTTAAGTSFLPRQLGAAGSAGPSCRHSLGTNVEWARKELEADGLGEEDFYSWPPEKRREFFITRTDYGAKLSAITDKFLREAWLDGVWGVFQGQYFTNFSYDRHTKPASEIELKPWWRRWISGDWGHEHPACIHLRAEHEKRHIYTYAELWGREIWRERIRASNSRDVWQREILLILAVLGRLRQAEQNYPQVHYGDDWCGDAQGITGSSYSSQRQNDGVIFLKR